MRYSLPIAALAAILGATPSFAYKVAGWEIESLATDGAFSSCRMTGAFQSGTVFKLVVDREWTWSISVTDDSLNAEKGDEARALVSVDGRAIETGPGRAVADNLVVITPRYTEGFARLMSGHGLAVTTFGRTFRLSLDGTNAAMTAILDCVKTNIAAAKSEPKRSPSRDGRPVDAAVEIPGDEAVVIATNLLSSAGITGYSMSKPDGTVASWTLPDGTVGTFFGYRNYRAEPETAASQVIQGMAANCKGDFASAKKSIPTSNGYVVRQVATSCVTGGSRVEATVTATQQPDGFLSIVSHIGGSGKPLPSGPGTAPDGMLQATLRSTAK